MNVEGKSVPGKTGDTQSEETELPAAEGFASCHVDRAHYRIAGREVMDVCSCDDAIAGIDQVCKRGANCRAH